MFAIPLLFAFSLTFAKPQAQLQITVGAGEELHILSSSVPLPEIVTNTLTRYVWQPKLPERLSVRWQGCTADGTCLLPKTEQWVIDVEGKVAKQDEPSPPTNGSRTNAHSSPFLRITAKALLEAIPPEAPFNYWGGQQSPEQFLATLRRPNGDENILQTYVSRYGWIVTSLAIFLLGLSLNLTPCVLPILPINVALLGFGKSRRSGFLYGLSYALGIASAYGILGGLLIRTGGFLGAIQSTVWFNASVAGLFFLLTLSVLGVVRIDFSRWLPRNAGKRGIAVSFTAGVIGALLAGACVSPIVLAVLLLGSALYAGGSIWALGLPLLLGLGMGAPWPLLGIGLPILPKPGIWLNYVKYPFALLLLVFSLHYGYLGFRSARFSSFTTDGTVGFKRDGRPLFIDLSASWCKNCLAMDLTTFADNQVKQALAGYQAVRIELDNPNEPWNRRLLERFGVKGLPAYIVIPSPEGQP
ncbi:MAG: cytochrome c biogenesis protein CcdA [Kiritimatiellia bacterium]